MCVRFFSHTQRVAQRKLSVWTYNNGCISSSEPDGSVVSSRCHASPMARSLCPLNFSLMPQSWTIVPKHNFQLNLEVKRLVGGNTAVKKKKKYSQKKVNKYIQRIAAISQRVVFGETYSLFDGWVMPMYGHLPRDCRCRFAQVLQSIIFTFQILINIDFLINTK